MTLASSVFGLSTFPLSSAGFVVALLFYSSSTSTSNSTWSIDAFTLPSRTPSTLRIPGPANRIIAHRGFHNIHGSREWWMIALSSSCAADSDIESFTSADDNSGNDESALQLLDKDDIEHINCLVQERSQARWQGNYTGADSLRHEITNFSGIPTGYEIFLQDTPRTLGGAGVWSLVRSTISEIEQTYDEEFLSGPTILQLAHTAMGLAVDDNQQIQTQQRQQYRQKSLEALVQQAKSRLKTLLDETTILAASTTATTTNDKNNTVFEFEVSTKKTMVQYELGGRKAADAALWFALAGSKDNDLFHGLADIASLELNRFGQRPSCRSKDVNQILERFAAAGLKRHDKLEQVAHACLLQKQQQVADGMSKVNNDCDHDHDDDDNIDDDNDSDTNKQSYLNLHSDRSLLLIWKFSTKQKKQRAFLRSAKKNWEQYHEMTTIDNTTQTETITSTTNNKEKLNPSKEIIIGSSYNWDEIFEDASRPLVVDVGCGMGVSLLGLASTTDQLPSGIESARLMLGENLKWSDCNFVGVDLGALGIEYGRGVALRWNLEGNLHFAVDAAEDFCQHLQSYPGEIRCCMIQFPT